MNTMLLVCGLLLAVGGTLVVSGVRYLRAVHSGTWDMPAVFACIIGGAMLLFGMAVPVNVYAGRAIGRVECRNWSTQTDRPARFVVYTSWDTGSCLTRDDHGKWISKDQVRQFGSGQ